MLGQVIDQIHGAAVKSEKKSVLNVAVIGAGTSGLCSAKNSIAQGHKVTVYEQSEQIGGIWHYTDKTGKDKYGIKIHTAMYQGLRYFKSQKLVFHFFSLNINFKIDTCGRVKKKSLLV